MIELNLKKNSETQKKNILRLKNNKPETGDTFIRN